MTTDDRGSAPGPEPVAGKDDLQRAVEERVAAAEAAAGSEPVVNAAPAKKAAKRAAAKKAPAKKAPAKAPAAAKASAKAATAKTTTAKKAPTKRAASKATPEPSTEDNPVTANPVVAPAPIAEPGDPTGAPAPQPAAPDPEQTESGSAQCTPAEEQAAAGMPAEDAPHVSEVTEEELRAIVEGWSYNPHGVLGAHPSGDGWAVRTLRPDAVDVAVLDQEGGRYPARLLREAGIYEARLPVQPGDYRIEVVYGDGQGGTNTYTVDDPYRWLPTLGPLDEHLIREGRHERLYDVLGAHVRRYDTPRGTVEGVSFAVWAPGARGVKVTGDFDYWQAGAYPMRSLGSSGVWEIFVPGVQVGSRYRYHVLGADSTWREKSDPLAFETEVPPLNASVVTESTHEGGDDAWLVERAAGGWHERPMSIYEVHAGSWRQGLSYRQLADELVDYVVAAGFTHIEFMPLAEHPFGGSWGYQVTSYYAPSARFGTPDDLRYLIDRAHQAGIGVIVDWVPAHFPKDDWALARFDGTALYEHEDPRRGEQPDWGTYVFNFGRREVRNFLVANACYWLEEFHVDGLRVDAVASMLYLDYSRKAGEWVPNVHGGRENLEAVSFLQEMNATVYKSVPGVVTIAEESTAWPGVTRPTYLGGLGFGFKWNMGWMHDSLDYMARPPIYRNYHHNQLTFSLVYAFSENYVLPISHDEVVYGKGSLLRKMPGDRWQQLANLRAFLGYMWAHPGKQLLFMGSEFGQLSEWAESGGLPWHLLEHPPHRGVRDLMAELNRVAAQWRALWERDHEPTGFQWLDADDAPHSAFAFLRWGHAGANAVACVANFTPVPRPGHKVGLPWAGEWRVLIDSDSGQFAGSGYRGQEATVSATSGQTWQGQPASAVFDLPPLAVVLLGAARP